ncbi:MAG TPA: flagellar biosynthesis protein FlhA [Armatimonadota bacterium]|nr:flagellar biosynthesis protein FlhA [Armatimonadota bacterium]HPP75306.1 flagellar biosynthesis protein FlhA [Armatimonadota bacterium]
MARSKASKLNVIAKHNDLLVALAAVVVISMLIMPMPQWLLDVLVTFNITLSLTILLVTVYSVHTLEFASFPAMLLVTTLFRLSLNISATRLILLHGSAGSVITAFGSVVVGGNYVVGIVVFIILVIVQFIVITNGTGRVAEVAARFTLDAMPGKQMAIDADLNAGIIDEKEAQERRKLISREADFYGAMDGASKFVRGDALAAVVMIIVNILGGFMVGMLQRHMDLMTALQTYTLLTVGQGLVTQIPGLLISTATGLMVTKAASESNIGNDLANQMFSQPKALTVTAGICAVLALIPGIPKLPFLLVAAGCGTVAYFLKQQPIKPDASATKAEEAPEAPKQPASMADLLVVDPIEVELGYGLIPLADPKQGGDLLERITAVRRHCATDLGLLVPAIRVRDNLQLKPNTYSIKLRGLEIAGGDIYPGQLLAMNPGTATTQLMGIETVEPAFGLPAIWVSEAQQSEAELSGYTVVDPLTVLITHLTEVLRKHAAEILTRQDTQTLIDNIKAQSPAVVDELIPSLMSIGDVQKVLQNLLAERVSIKDLSTILEALADAATVTKDTDMLSEYVRQALARQITRQYQTGDTIRVFALDPSVEQVIADGLRQSEAGIQLMLDPVTVQKVLESTKAQVERMAASGNQPIAFCSPRIRIHYRRLVERMIPTLAVLSYNELCSGVKLETVGMVSLENEDSTYQVPQYA